MQRYNILEKLLFLIIFGIFLVACDSSSNDFIADLELETDNIEQADMDEEKLDDFDRETAERDKGTEIAIEEDYDRDMEENFDDTDNGENDVSEEIDNLELEEIESAEIETDNDDDSIESEETEEADSDEGDLHDSEQDQEVTSCSIGNSCETVHRTCQMIGAEEVCGNCLGGFHGLNGECIQDEECFETTCNGNGNCQIVSGEVSCSCHTGYFGEWCGFCDGDSGYRWNEEREDCVFTPCQDNSQCDIDNHEYCINDVGHCMCGSYYYRSHDGKTCTNDPCDANPCRVLPNSTGVCEKHHAKRRDTIYYYTCECEEYYTYTNRQCLLDCEEQCGEVGSLLCYRGDLYRCESINQLCSSWVFLEECESGHCEDNQSCHICENECVFYGEQCNGDILEICESDNQGCRILRTEYCDLGCSDDACLTQLCGSGEVEGSEFCDSDGILCSSLCGDYGEDTAPCNDYCTTYDSSFCVQPEVVQGFVPIEATIFEMRYASEFLVDPVEVTLTRDFEIMKLKVTQQDFQNVMGYNPSDFIECGPSCPVENVTYFDAIHYANRLSTQEGLNPCIEFQEVLCADDTSAENEEDCLTRGGIANAVISLANLDTIYNCEGYRLATEVEWELAARAGTETSLYNGRITFQDRYALDPTIDLVSWYLPNSIVDYDGDPFCAERLEMPGIVCGTHPVGLKQPNTNCLYDMIGNTFEWVYDFFSYEQYYWPMTDPVFDLSTIEYSLTDEVDMPVRGCCWLTDGNICRTSTRIPFPSTTKGNYMGFRLVRTLETQSSE